MLFNDPIAFAPVGGGLPSGFSFLGSGGGTIRAFSNHGAFSPHNWLTFSGSDLAAGLDTGPLVDTITVWFAFKNQGFSMRGPIFRTWGYNTVGQRIITSELRAEPDSTLSIYVAGSPNVFIANTGGGAVPFFISSNVWFYFKLTITIDFDVLGFLRVNYNNIWIDGTSVLSGRGVSNFYTDQSFIGAVAVPPTPGDPGMNFIDFCQSNGSGEIGLGEVYATEGIASTASLPGNLWDLIIDDPGIDYGPLPPVINILRATGGSGNATLACTIDVGPGSGMTGKVLSIVPISAKFLGDGYVHADEPILLTATPFGTPNGSGFAGHATLVPDAFRRFNQLAVEKSTAPTDVAFNRFNQVVIEKARHPTTNDFPAFIRFAQIVIELPPRRGPGPSGAVPFWIDCDMMTSNPARSWTDSDHYQ